MSIKFREHAPHRANHSAVLGEDHIDVHGKLSRRDFILTTSAIAGGLAVCAIWADVADAAYVEGQPWSRPVAKGMSEVGPWISIGADDAVLIRTNVPECGNGAMTQMALSVTEELQCDWTRVKVECVSINRDARENQVYSKVGGFIGTFGGRSTNPERMQLWLQVGASARERLKAAAAAHWNVAVVEIEAKDSVLTHRPTGRMLRFGDVAARAATIRLASEPALKPATQWTVLGKLSPTKLSNPSIVNGSAVFGMDVRLPGMLYAALLQSPVQGGRLKSYSFEAIRNMPGVRGVAVVDPAEPRKTKLSFLENDDNTPQSAIAVVADHYWQARKALEALPVEWNDGPGARWKSTEQLNQALFAEFDNPDVEVREERGDVLKVLRDTTKTIEATYLTPFCDQAVMEPLNGTALVTENRVEIWHPAAVTRWAALVAADEVGVPLQNVHVNQTYVGGSFGRRLSGDDARMVVAVAKKFPGHPVHVIWSREETMRQGRYRPLQAVKFTAALGANGLPHAVRARVASTRIDQTGGLTDSAYSNSLVPNFRVEYRRLPLHILTGAYRAPGSNTHVFFVESFIDECAAAAGFDPLEYRLRMFAQWPDWMKVLQQVGTRSSWGKTLPRGQGQGLAICNWGPGKPQAGTIVAAVAHVDVARGGELRVLQLDLAFDCGRVLHRDAVLAQLEGGMIFGLNMSLNEELNIANGRIVECNFDAYPMLRMADVPRRLNVHFGAVSGHERLAEVGEPPVLPIGPAVANAIYRATGKRIRTMPFRKHDLSWS